MDMAEVRSGGQMNVYLPTYYMFDVNNFALRAKLLLRDATYC